MRGLNGTRETGGTVARGKNKQLVRKFMSRRGVARGGGSGGSSTPFVMPCNDVI